MLSCARGSGQESVVCDHIGLECGARIITHILDNGNYGSVVFERGFAKPTPCKVCE
jgi:hypothetical protein